jgi:hypothetical protein
LKEFKQKATRFVLHFSESNYQNRLIELDLLPLAYSREYYDIIIMFCKCLFDIYMYDVNVSNFVSFTKDNAVPTRSTLDFTNICITATKTLLYQKSYFTRVVFCETASHYTLITQIIMKLEYLCFAWRFPFTRRSFNMCMVGHDLLSRSLKVIYQVVFQLFMHTYTF